MLLLNRRMNSTTGNEPLLHFKDRAEEEESKADNLVKKTCQESKKIWEIAGPSIFSRLAMFSLTVISQSFAGHLGNRDLAAISLATTFFIPITFGFLLGMASALETLCGQAYGAKQYHMLGVYLQRSWIVLFISSILQLPLFVYAAPILELLGQPEAVAKLTGKVAILLIPMHLSFPFQFTLLRFLQCQLKTSVIAWVSGGTLALHVVLSWIFLYELGVGIVGTALILDFSWWISVLGFLAYIVFGGCPHSWTGFSMQAFVGLWDFFKLSVASGVMLLLEHIYFRVLVIVSGYMNNTEVAVDALSICVTIIGWESMIPLGLLAATGVRVANELGAGNGNRAKFATKVALLNTLALGILFWSIVMAFPDKLSMIFTSSTPVTKMVCGFAFLLATTILCNCIQPVLSGVAIGSGWQAHVAYVNLGSYYLVGVPLGILFGWSLNFGLTGLWYGMIMGTIVQTLILTIMTIRCQWTR
ncbi:protein DETOXIFICATION 27 [Nicotiana tabacum]|uniref:Protein DETOXIFICATION n=1 Tax=Nicotiana tabacum TaxID=4097 RepID=A0A1S3XXI7_TOBAC|nr:protein DETOXIFICATION 27-like [Nicotiana tomentosiformis]XP_009596941.1 protein DETOXIFICATION 27-like [Nicotiana tomentosiformis]XP_016444661.1 PREDICTED: protein DETOXIFICATION 27-like [Nicotiana tabacum]XP_016444662.1 PREDICTED: protein DETOXIFICATION 27-like [Nicotiana tabacum]